MLGGRIPLDDGEVQRRPGLRIASVEQEPVLPDAPTVRESLVLRGAIREHRTTSATVMAPKRGSTNTCSASP